jgi:hypothetical protein
MTSTVNLYRRLSQLERTANAAKARWFTARNGIIPDEYRPDIDNLIAVRFVDDATLTWRGKPYSPPDMKTVTIGGE